MEVSVITTTANRKQFIPRLIECYESQNYPKDKMEWIILDDNADSQQLFDNLSERLPNIRYITQSPGKMGAKLNRLCKEVKGKIKNAKKRIREWERSSTYYFRIVKPLKQGIGQGSHIAQQGV